ncbi:MAG: TonB-dependent receptor [Candidatus Sulfopaludibacter sp.]|nr:TonB-dependent receptor [Candidatus Sulfopaludibacter sp.]
MIYWRQIVTLVLFAVPAPGFGQSAAAGALEGSVSDTSGHHLAEVSVRLLNEATNEHQEVKADAAGSFHFSLIPAGTYQVEFVLPGFKTARLGELTLNASEVPMLEAVLEPGDSSVTVACPCRVRAAAPSTGTLVDQKTITAVPLNTRNFTQVLSMSSGSVASVNNAGTLGRGTPSVNVNGNTTAGGYTVDGSYAPSTVPNPDAISEFKIQTSQNDAMFGAMVPNTNLMTKRGENNFHGDFWEFLRNDIFNANAFFRNSTGQPKPNLKQNQFGATAGGPVKRDRVFFFGSYQGTRQVNGLDNTSTSNLILPGLTGDRSAATLAAQFCPGNRISDSRYQTYAGGRQLDCHDENTAATAAINPIALRLLQMKGSDGQYLIPTPQTTISSGSNAGLGFSTYSMPSTYNEHHFLGNGDYVAGPANALSSRLFAATVDQLRTFGSPGGYPGAPIVPGFGSPQALAATDVAASVRLTTQMGANRVNEAVMTFTRNRTDTKGVGTPSAAQVGMTPVDAMFPEPPEITVLGPMGSFRLFGSDPNDNHFETRTYSWADNVSRVRGRQRLRGGGFFLDQYNGRSDTGGARGKITFQTFEDFLVGLSAAENQSPAGRSNIQAVQANEGVGPYGEVVYRYQHYYGAAFVQDDVKVSSRLTVNLGLRWEYIGPSIDEDGTIGNLSPSLLRSTAVPGPGGTLAGNTVAANYDANLVNPYTGRPFGPAPAGVAVRGSKSFYDNGAPLDKFAPRVGFAWQPSGSSGRIVAGGAYGWFYQNPPYSGNASSAPLFTSVPFAQGFTNADSSNNYATFEKPFPTTTLGYVPRTLTSQLSDRVAGPEYRIPRLQQWNLTTKIRLPRNLSLDLGYVGSHGSQLLLARGLNQPLMATAAQPVNCGYDGVASDCIATNTAANAAQRVPVLGETQTALLTSEFTGASWYHSLQATLRKQLSSGLTFQAAYTFSKAENNLTVLNDQNDPGLDKARAAFDRTDRLIANFDYQLPLRGGNSRLGRALAQGWSLTGIVLVQSGLPLTLTDVNGGTVYGRAATSTITMCRNASYASLATAGSVSARLDRWINPAAVCAPPVRGSDGSAGYGNAGQSILNGPGQVNSDLSLGKRSRVGGLREGAELSFRVEFYNAMNHAQFANPGTTYQTAGFGAITQTAVAPRLIQFGLKYLF